MSNLLMAATTETSSKIVTIPPGKIGILIANGIAGVEYVGISILCGDTFVTCYDFDTGNPVQLTATKNPIKLLGPATYQVSKSATLAATSLGFEV